MTIQEIIKAYYDGWLRKDLDRVKSLVTDDLKFRSPEDDFDSAESFLNACWKYSEEFDTITIEHEVYGPDSGYIVYSSGDMCCGELLKFRDDKICEIYVTFNPTR